MTERNARKRAAYKKRKKLRCLPESEWVISFTIALIGKHNRSKLPEPEYCEIIDELIYRDVHYYGAHPILFSRDFGCLKGELHDKFVDECHHAVVNEAIDRYGLPGGFHTVVISSSLSRTYA